MKSSRNFGEEAGSISQPPFMLQLLPASPGNPVLVLEPLTYCLTGAYGSGGANAFLSLYRLGSEHLSVLTLQGDVSMLEDRVFTTTGKTAPSFFPEILICPRAASSQGPNH